MSTFRFAAFLVVVFVQYAFAQATQPAVSQPAAVQAPEKAQPQPEPSTSPQQNSQNNNSQQPASQVPNHNQFKFNLGPPKTSPNDKKLPTGTLDRGFRAFVAPQLPGFTVLPTPYQTWRLAPVQNADDLLAGDPRGKFDQGIYAGAGAVCGSIVSYNFSQAAPGEMPKLESVTTCTPSNKVVPRRAQGHPAKPVQPPLQRAGFTPL